MKRVGKLRNDGLVFITRSVQFYVNKAEIAHCSLYQSIVNLYLYRYDICLYAHTALFIPLIWL